MSSKINGTVLNLKAKATQAYIGFENNNGAELGYYGFSSTNTPAVYIDGETKKVYHEGYKPTAEEIGAVSSTSSMEGAFLRIVDGKATWVNIESAEGATFG